MYNTSYDPWGNHVYTIITEKINKEYKTVAFYHEPYTFDIKRIEELSTTNWFKKNINHYKMVKKYIKGTKDLF